MNKSLRQITTLIVLIISSKAATGALPVSEIEWKNWGEYCQLNYILSGYGDNSKYAKTIPRQYAIERNKKNHESFHIPGAHHFCYGILHIKRAAISATSSRKRIDSAKSAAAEFKYSYDRLDGKDPAATATVLSFYGRALWLSGERKYAHEIWDEGLSSGLTDMSLVAAKAEALIYESNFSEAESLLENWKKNKLDVPEINYWLAMTYCHTAKFQLAEELVAKALNSGFPASHLFQQIKSRKCVVDKKAGD